MDSSYPYGSALFHLMDLERLRAGCFTHNASTPPCAILTLTVPLTAPFQAQHYAMVNIVHIHYAMLDIMQVYCALLYMVQVRDAVPYIVFKA